jgi:hypothetical protein
VLNIQQYMLIFQHNERLATRGCLTAVPPPSRDVTETIRLVTSTGVALRMTRVRAAPAATVRPNQMRRVLVQFAVNVGEYK